MADGGASPAEFTDRVEAVLPPEPTDILGPFQTADLMTDYLAALRELVDVEAIRGANLRVVCDPLYGAGRHYLAGLLRDMGVEVVEIHNTEDPTFAGLHPEPIQPWVDEGLAKVGELGYDALFINDGDADRIAAGDSRGNYVNAHRIITQASPSKSSFTPSRRSTSSTRLPAISSAVYVGTVSARKRAI